MLELRHCTTAVAEAPVVTPTRHLFPQLEELRVVRCDINGRTLMELVKIGRGLEETAKLQLPKMLCAHSVSVFWNVPGSHQLSPNFESI